MAPYRVLIVDDSAFMRQIFSDLIAKDEQFEIVATAANGAEAVEAAARWKPDVITLDLEMPVMNGIEALQLIMQRNPIPVIMLSGISEENTRETINALQLGAFDFIRKPSSGVSDEIVQVGERLMEKLRIAVLTQRRPAAETGKKVEPKANAVSPKPASPPRAKQTAPLKPPIPKAEQPKEKQPKEKQPPQAAKPLEPSRPSKPSKAKSELFRHIVAIGTSTGGPRALQEVIGSLPEQFPAPVLVVQHMPPKFTKSLAQRLDNFSALQVVEAEQGARVTAGVVYIAPGGHHMKLAKDAYGYTIELTMEPQRNGHRPSVDVLFESLVPIQELKRHAVIMTGMGSDGAKGMKLLAESGAQSTIAEAEESCVVYGMPRSAIEGGSVRSILPLQRIAPHLANTVL